MAGFLVLTTVPSQAAARKLAEHLLKKRLAACVSYRSGFRSVYRWKGKVERSNETLLLIKTARSRFHRLSRELLARHPYELPEIAGFAMTKGSAAYLAWLEKETR